MRIPKVSRDALLDLATIRLNELVIEGYEYPDALWLAANQYGVVKDSETIAARYDAQFA